MSPVRVTWRRTVGRLKSLYSTSLAACGFVSACAAIFAFSLESAEGSRLPLAAVWAASVSPVLPVLASLLAMDTWSEERRAGRADMLLTAPVRERELVFGKFLGVWTILVGLTAFFHFATMAFLAAFAPRLLSGVSYMGFVPGFIGLALQGAMWSAIAVAMSAAIRNPAAAAMTSVFFLAALPRCVWSALLAWAPQGRSAFGEMPLDAHAGDMACGLVSSATVITYVVVATTALFVASKLVASFRFTGRGAAGIRASTSFSVVLALALAVSTAALAYRLDMSLDIQMAVGNTGFSARTSGVLSEIRGELGVTAFVSRKDPSFRETAHFLRSLARASEAQGGARISVSFVDPRWDLGSAERLVRSGVKEGSIVFRRGHRTESVSVAGGCDERACVSAIMRVAMPPQRRSVYWTTGHGEASFDTYGAFGMSDIARDVARDGYRNEKLDLASVQQVPPDCALVVVAGPKDEFPRVESGRLEAYLRQGGRMLVLVATDDSRGVLTLLSAWGVRTKAATFPDARTLSGTDVVVSEFSSHAISEPLQGSQIVLDRPLAFTPSAAASQGGGADRIEFTELAKACGSCVAAVAERGVGTGDDLQIRPTRIVAIGDPGFVMNGQLASRASANRDFFHNCIAYLAGTDAVTGAGDEPGRVVSGMDRSARARFLVYFAVAFPSCLFLVLAAFVAIGRRRG